MTAIERNGVAGALVGSGSRPVATATAPQARHASALRAALTWHRMFYRARHGR
jgi:hypothetical protein